MPDRLALTKSLGRVQQVLFSIEQAVTPRSPAEVIRATVSHSTDAQAVLDEYYREIGVIQRDSAEALQDFLENSASGLWLAYVQGAVAGCVVLRPLKRVRAAGECKRLYVRAQFRGRGIADTLLDAMEDYARSSSLSWIYLDSKDDLQAAITLYRRRGYEPCERYNDNPQATVFLRKSLKLGS